MVEDCTKIEQVEEDLVWPEREKTVIGRVMSWRPIESAPRDGSFILLFVPGDQLEIGKKGVTVGVYVPPEEGEDVRDMRGRFKKQHPWWTPEWGHWLGNDGDNSASWCDPTHWMPLPEPPK